MLYFAMSASLFVYLAFYSMSVRGWLAVFAVNVGVFTVASVARSFTLLSDPPEPVFPENTQNLENFPTLQEELVSVAREAARPVPLRVQFSVSDIDQDTDSRWTNISPDSADAFLTIPVGAISLWSRFELRCYVAQRLLRPAPPAWLFRLAAAELQPGGSLPIVPRHQGVQNRYVGAYVHNLLRLRELLATWALLADLSADRQIARRYGQSNTLQFLKKSWYSQQAFEWYLQLMVLPALRRGLLPPILLGFKSWFEAASSEEDQDAPAVTIDGDPGAPSDGQALPPHVVAMLTRVRIVEGLAETNPVEDHRAALDLLGERAQFERSLIPQIAQLDASGAAMAFLEDGEPTQISWEDFLPNVILAEYRERIERNSAIFADKTIGDIPTLVSDRVRYSQLFVPEPGTLPSEEQLLAQFLNSLAHFIVVELVDQGAIAHFTVSEGLTISATKNGPPFDPTAVIQRLQSGEMNSIEFQAEMKAAQ